MQNVKLPQAMAVAQEVRRELEWLQNAIKEAPDGLVAELTVIKLNHEQVVANIDKQVAEAEVTVSSSLLEKYFGNGDIKESIADDPIVKG